ncbi:MAG: substrate-binding domain-containing protein [Prevotella sp.]
MKHSFLFLPLLAIIAVLCLSCGERPIKYRIGVSQCSEDSWRFKQNNELRLSQYADTRIQLEITSADDSDEQQIKQISHFIDEKVDLLIVSPNSAVNLTDIVSKAYDKGIPVVLFDRKTNGDKYTAFMGTDNIQLGKMLGHYIARCIGGKGVVVEIQGLQASSPSVGRHRGFVEAMADYPDIRVISSEGGADWTAKSGEKAMNEILRTYDGEIAAVYGHNDRLAMGARGVAEAHGKKGIKYFGIDALPTPGGGMELVQKGLMEATCIYPTRGLQLMKLATNILDGNKYDKENILTSTIVDRNNVDILLSQNIEQQRVSDDLEVVKGKLDDYFSQVNFQQKVIVAFVIVLIIIMTLGVIAYRSYLQKLIVNEEVTKDVVVPADTPKAESPFLERFRSILQQNLHDADFNVERIGEEMGMSRVQLYRKVKQLTGMTPVELLRKARLARGRQLLETTVRSISEIAYDTGFSAPSYFTKCFKDEYGISPGEVRS